MKYQKSSKYTDYKTIYAQCSGPGGLKLAEFMAEKMEIKSGKRLIDIGVYRGYQTCFLAKEYGVNIIGIDPWDDRETGIPHIDFLMKNAESFGVSNQIIGVKSGVPESLLPADCFDYAYSTTTLEMVRGYAGGEAYIDSLKEIHRVLKKGGVFGLGEPMHFDLPVPVDLAPHVQNNMWEKCFATIKQTEKAVRQAGFEILQAGYCKEADAWWKEFSTYSPEYDAVEDDTIVIQHNNNRWLSFGYVIAVK